MSEPLVEIATNLDAPRDIKINGDFIYLSLAGGDKIIRANLNQLPLQFEDILLVSEPRGMVFDNDDLYYTYKATASGNYALARLDTSTLNLNKQESNPDLELYPNPTAGILNLNNRGAASEYGIYGMQGRLLQNGIVEPGIGLDVSALTAGRYFLRLENGGFQSFLKK